MKANDGPHRGTAGAGGSAKDGDQNPTPLPPRDPKDLDWLRGVMNSIEMPDKAMKRILKQLHRLDDGVTKKVEDDAQGAVVTPTAAAGSSGEESEEPMTSEELVDMLLSGPLDELQESVEDLNFAVEFQLMKGPETVLYKLDGPTARSNAELRTVLFLTIAHASQNLPDLQDSFSKLEWARQVVPMLRDETDPAAAAANILACSSMCRGSAKASGEFVNAGGFDALFAVLSRNVALFDAGKKNEVDVKSCLRGIRLLDYFLQGRVSSSQILEKVATFTLPLVVVGEEEETLSQEDLRVTATEYMLTFFSLLGADMQVRAKAVCQEKILPGLLSIQEADLSPEQKKLLEHIN